MTIGDFARLGGVSVRMLRHYDKVGLLQPAAVDPSSGYRSYSAEQLARLHRLVAMKDLGFTLDQVGALLDDEPDPAEIRGMLRLRRAELAAEQQAALARLTAVEHRLHLIEQEHSMIETVTKQIPATRLAAGRATVSGPEEVGPAIEQVFARTGQAVAAAGGSLETPMASYTMDDDGLHLTAGYAYTGSPLDGIEMVDLPGAEQAVCAVHLGEMATISTTWQGIWQSIESQGLIADGPGREVYLRAYPVDDQSEWVTEIQQPVRRA